jgi:hypothetical protein
MTHGAALLAMLDLLNYEFWLRSPLAWVALAFQLWMLIDAIRRQEWIWVVFIIIFPLLNAVLYYFLVYRNASGSSAPLELPGSGDRRRIKELQGQIHHLDKAHHHAQLGEVYLRQQKFDLAEASFRAALERDPEDADTRAHLGECLLRRGKPEEAVPLLESVCQPNPKHNYGYSLMALAEAYAATGKTDLALQSWQQVAENYSYARARVALAELHLAAGQPHLAKGRLQEVVADDAHAPEFGRRSEKHWIKRAKKLLSGLN